MATGLLWADGFDLYDSESQGWDQGGNHGTISTSYRRGSYGQGYRAISNDSRRLVAPDGSAKTHTIVGAAIKADDNNVWDSRNGRMVLLVFYKTDYSSPQGAFYVRVNGAVGFMRGNVTETHTVLGETAAGVWKYGIWNYVEFRVVWSNTVGEIEILVNGEQVVNLTGQDTCLQTTESVDLFQIQSGYNSTVYFDDMYMIDRSVGAGFIGDCVVRGQLPTADGNYTAWTASAGSAYACVDDNPPNDDTDYISETVVGDKATFVMANTELSTADVKAVGVRWRGKKTDGVTREVRGLFRHSSTDANGATRAMTAGYLTYQDLRDDVPGGTGWTLTQAHDAEVGVEVVT